MPLLQVCSSHTKFVSISHKVCVDKNVGSPFDF